MAIVNVLLGLSVLLSMGATGVQAIVAGMNDATRQWVTKLAATISREVARGRIDVNSLLNRVREGNLSALANSLATNPVIAKDASVIQAQIKKGDTLQAEYDRLAAAYDNVVASMNSRGYSGTMLFKKGAFEQYNDQANDYWKAVDLKNKLDAKEAEIKKFAASDTGGTRSITPNFSSIKQNITGGIK